MTAAPAFVHLRLHTEYSVVDGTLRIDDAAKAARADGQVAMGISDLNNLFGAIKFYKACRGKGVKPLIGVDVWMEPLADTGDKLPSRLLLLVQDSRGYLNISELLARAWTQNAQRAQAWVKWDWLAELGAGLIALSGADLGAIGAALLAGDRERAATVARRLAELFPGRFYIELQRAGAPTHEPHVRAAVPLAAELGLPVVATHPVQFLESDDFEAHEARVCVAEGETLGNPKRVKRFTPEQYFKTQAQMAALFADVPSALANTVAIAQRCNLTLVLGKPQLPDFPTPSTARRHSDADGATTSASQLRGPGKAAGWRSTPTRRERDRQAAALRRAAGVRDRHHHQDGLPGLLPDRLGLHRLGQGQRLPGGPRAGARAPVRWWPTRCRSPTSTRCATTCCSSAS
jgi:DNA polymerase-3 subunit alpha